MKCILEWTFVMVVFNLYNIDSSLLVNIMFMGGEIKSLVVGVGGFLLIVAVGSVYFVFHKYYVEFDKELYCSDR